MPRLVASVGLVIVLTTGPAAADDWFARDKGLHFGVSAGIAAGSYGIAAVATEKRWKRALIGVGTALLVGVGKETYDAVGPGDPSGRDLAWDAGGAAVGAGLALSLDALLRRHPRPTRSVEAGTAVRNPRIDW